VPRAADVTIAVMSASKAFNLAGLKCAAIVTASPRMRDVVARIPPNAGWRIGHFGAIATVAAFRDGGPWLDRLLATLDARRAQLGRFLEERLPDVSWHRPEATYLAWLDCSAIGPDNTARDVFLDKGRVAVEPGLAFGAAGSGFVRLNYATSAEILDAATAAMATALP
jgi:cystathionine beta-lyase